MKSRDELKNAKSKKKKKKGKVFFSMDHKLPFLHNKNIQTHAGIFCQPCFVETYLVAGIWGQSVR